MFLRKILLFVLLLAPVGALAIRCPTNPVTGLPSCITAQCTAGNNVARGQCAPVATSAATESQSQNFFKTTQGQVVTAVVAGAIVIGLAWYFFNTSKSDNFDNQVKLASF